MKITERYASAVKSSNLSVEESTVFSDTDVLGAMGIADSHFTEPREGDDPTPHPLAVALLRLFMGDNGAAPRIVEILADMARGKARALRMKMPGVRAEDLAKAALAWHRDGICKPCGGHGHTLIPGTTTLSSHECPVCKGSGRIDFEDQVRDEHVEIARWLIAEMEREMGRAGPAAMRAIAPRLDL